MNGVLNHIYHQFFFTANTLGRKPTTSQYSQPLAPQTFVLVAAAIHCALSQYAGGKKATGMFSQDEYRGTFCTSPTIHFTAKATPLINHTLVGRFETPPPPPTTMQHDSTRIGRSSIPVGAPQPRFTLFYILPQSIPPLLVLLRWDRHSMIPSVLI